MSDKNQPTNRRRFSTRRAETPKSKYEDAVDEFKKLLADKTHPDNKTAAYNKNILSVFNRLMTAAEEVEFDDPGAGVFGLIILALRANLALKDKKIELEVQIRDLEKRIKRLEKR
jgi:hypothetical protein